MVRRIQETDAARVAELDAELFPEICWNENTVRREIQLGWGLAALDTKGRIIAFLLTRLDGQMTDITRVGVTKKFQRRGFGRMLLRSAIGVVEGGPMMLTIRKDNEAAKKLYLKEGFTARSATKEGGIILVRDQA